MFAAVLRLIVVSGLFVTDAFAVNVDIERKDTEFTARIASSSEGTWRLVDEHKNICAEGAFRSGTSSIELDNLPPSEDLVLNVFSSGRTTPETFSARAPASLSPLSKPDHSSAIYQLPVRTYFATGKGYANRGKLQDLTLNRLKQIQALGVDYIWLTGVIRNAHPANVDVDIVKGDAGSYYAIVDSWNVSDQIGSISDLIRVIDQSHSIGLRVLLDLVVNHTARVHKTDLKCKAAFDFGRRDDSSAFFRGGNNYYYVQSRSAFKPPVRSSSPGGDGQFDSDMEQPGIQLEMPARVSGNNIVSHQPAVTDWFETSKLNYGYDFSVRAKHYDPIPPTWDSVSDIAIYWLKMGIDGFRVDFAHSVPIEFWQYFVQRVRDVQPNAFLLAEAYETDLAMKIPGFSYEALLDAGFDSVYNSEFYWGMRRSLENNRTTLTRFDSSPAMRSSIVRKGYRFTQYIENHDEVRIASEKLLPSLSNRSARAWVGYNLSVFYSLLPGHFIVHGGQEIEEEARIPGEFEGSTGKTSIFDFVYQEQTLAWLRGTADRATMISRQNYSRLLQLRAQSPFNVGNISDRPSYKSLDFANTDVNYLSAYVRFDGDQSYLVIMNNDPFNAHEMTVHFTDRDGSDPGGVLKGLGIENSDRRFVFVESLNREGWIPVDPNIEGVGIPGSSLFKAAGVPSGLYLGQVPAGVAYVFKIIRYDD